MFLSNGGMEAVVNEAFTRAPLAKKMPGAELVLLPRTGHLVPQVRPQAVITAIDAAATRSPAPWEPNHALKSPAER
jgi:pimeloyl-ACP methyl ester carboxylesterase